MGKKWLKMEDFANIAQRLNVTLDGRLEDMRKAQLVDIWAELEATYHDKAGPSFLAFRLDCPRDRRRCVERSDPVERSFWSP